MVCCPRLYAGKIPFYQSGEEFHLTVPRPETVSPLGSGAGSRRSLHRIRGPLSGCCVAEGIFQNKMPGSVLHRISLPLQPGLAAREGETPDPAEPILSSAGGIFENKARFSSYDYKSYALLLSAPLDHHVILSAA